MRKLRWSTASLCLLVCVTFGNVSRAGEVWDDYLAVAEGDSVLAHTNMESDILLFSGEVIDLEADLKKEEARSDRLSTWFAEERGNWFDRLYDSEAMKFIVFVAGVWLGTYAAGIT
jgi:hypothetical protein